MIPIRFCKGVANFVELTPRVYASVAIVLMSLYPVEGPGERRGFQLIPNIGKEIERCSLGIKWIGAGGMKHGLNSVETAVNAASGDRMNLTDTVNSCQDARDTTKFRLIGGLVFLGTWNLIESNNVVRFPVDAF